MFNAIDSLRRKPLFTFYKIPMTAGSIKKLTRFIRDRQAEIIQSSIEKNHWHADHHYILEQRKKWTGLLVLRKSLTNCFSKIGIEKSLEIKMIFGQTQKHLRFLMDKTFESACEMGARSVCITIDRHMLNPSLHDFFMKYGFNISSKIKRSTLLLSAKVMARIPVSSKIFEQLQMGQKTVEARVNKGMWQSMCEGELIAFFHGKRTIVCRIKKINKYDSFQNMLQTEGFETAFPEVKNRDEALSHCYALAGMPFEKIEQDGVISLHLEKQTAHLYRKPFKNRILHKILI